MAQRTHELLWKPTLAHLSEAERELETQILRSRTEWLWRGTTKTQRHVERREETLEYTFMALVPRLIHLMGISLYAVT